MRWTIALAAMALAGLALAGCEKADNAPGPGGVTVGEARALDEAAQMIDARQPPPGLAEPSRTQWPAAEPARDAASLPAATDKPGEERQSFARHLPE